MPNAAAGANPDRADDGSGCGDKGSVINFRIKVEKRGYIRAGWAGHYGRSFGASGYHYAQTRGTGGDRRSDSRPQFSMPARLVRFILLAFMNSSLYLLKGRKNWRPKWHLNYLIFPMRMMRWLNSA
jgi:hypothetical protein